MANKICVLCGGAAGVLVLSAAASASISAPFIFIRATNASGSGTFSVPLADVTPIAGGGGTFSLAAPVDIMSGPNVIGTVTQLNSSARPLAGAQPETLTLSFTFFAGSSATRFEVFSTLFTFDDPILNEAGRATAGITVTDSDNDGVMSTGNFAGGAHYSSRYNGQVPAGTTFANLLMGPVSAGNGSSNTANDRSPPGSGFTPIGTDVTNMSAGWDFTLTSGDQVGATSSFFIVPAPGAFALMGLAGIAMSRRSRR
jgi:hypothetical protein